MNRILFLATLLAGGTSLPAYCQAQVAIFSKVDTLSSQPLPLLFRAGSRPSLGSSQSARQLLTLVVRPNATQAGQNILLPIGIDPQTVSVRSGESLLRLETDYIFLPATNRLRIVSPTALRSDQAIRITYRRLDFTL